MTILKYVGDLNQTRLANFQSMLRKMLPMYQRVRYLTFLLVKNFSLDPLITSQKPNTHLPVGGVAEWLNAPVLKTDVGESLPWVRIPPPPPYALILIIINIWLLKIRKVASPILSPNRFKPNIHQQMCHQPSKSYTVSFWA